MKISKKLISILLIVVLTATILIVPASVSAATNTGGKYLPIPENLRQIKDTDTSIATQWNKCINSGSYKIRIKELRDNKWSVLKTKKDIKYSTTKYIFKNLKKNTKYLVQIGTVKGKTESGWSNSVAMLTKPPKVTGIKQTKATKNSVTIKWNNVINEYCVYEIFYSKAGKNDFKYYGRTNKTENKITISKLKKNTKYDVKIQIAYYAGSYTIRSKFSDIKTIKTAK